LEIASLRTTLDSCSLSLSLSLEARSTRPRHVSRNRRPRDTARTHKFVSFPFCGTTPTAAPVGSGRCSSSSSSNNNNSHEEDDHDDDVTSHRDSPVLLGVSPFLGGGGVEHRRTCDPSQGYGMIQVKDALDWILVRGGCDAGDVERKGQGG